MVYERSSLFFYHYQTFSKNEIIRILKCQNTAGSSLLKRKWYEVDNYTDMDGVNASGKCSKKWRNKNVLCVKDGKQSF